MPSMLGMRGAATRARVAARPALSVRLRGGYGRADVAEAIEREPQAEPAVPAAAGPASAIAISSARELAGAGVHARPSLSRSLVMRLQSSAGNAAVAGLVEGHESPTAYKS